MLERELGLASDPGATRALDEFLALESVQTLLQLASLRSRGERAYPEDLADDRRVLQQRLLVRWERIQASGNDALHGFRQRQVMDGLPLDEHADELLGVERVAAGTGHQRTLGLRL